MIYQIYILMNLLENLDSFFQKVILCRFLLYLYLYPLVILPSFLGPWFVVVVIGELYEVALAVSHERLRG